MRGELGLELGDQRRERPDVAAERLDPLARGLDLRGERSLFPLGRVDLLAEAGDLPVEVRLSVGRGLSERRGDGQRRGERRGALRVDRCGERQPPERFRRECRRPCASPPGSSVSNGLCCSTAPGRRALLADQVFEAREGRRRFVSGAGGCSGSGGGSPGEGSGTGSGKGSGTWRARAGFPRRAAETAPGRAPARAAPPAGPWARPRPVPGVPAPSSRRRAPRSRLSFALDARAETSSTAPSPRRPRPLAGVRGPPELVVAAVSLRLELGELPAEAEELELAARAGPDDAPMARTSLVARRLPAARRPASSGATKTTAAASAERERRPRATPGRRGAGCRRRRGRARPAARGRAATSTSAAAPRRPAGRERAAALAAEAALARARRVRRLGTQRLASTSSRSRSRAYLHARGPVSASPAWRRSGPTSAR